MIALLAACTAPAPLVVVTFNTGTTTGLPHDAAPDDGFTGAMADLSDAHYGDGLAWPPAIGAARAFLADADPDVVAFQEIFWSPDCVDVPPEATPGFVCETWSRGDPTVAQTVLGDAFQLACFPGHPDKCLAVNRRLGTFEGCADPVCDTLVGVEVPGCGSGARVARGVIDTDRGRLVVVGVHGSSGFSTADHACRVAQVEQVFVDLDGEPAANGPPTVVLGDLNTDPGRYTPFDESARRWLDFVGPRRDFQWITDLGGAATYQGVASIDHVASDAFDGTCVIAGVTDGHPAVTDAVYFDHHPVTCTLTDRP